MYRRGALVALASLSTAGCLRLSAEEDSGGDGTGSGANASGGDGGGGGSGDGSGDGLSTDGAADIWVAPGDGRGGEGGDGTEASPFSDVQHALNVAEPGDTIRLESGEYRQQLSTTTAGEPENPITLTGPPDAVVRGSEPGETVFGILHSHVHVTGLTFDGLVDPDRQWETPEAWADEIVTTGPGPRYEGGVDYISDVVFEPHAVRNARSGFVVARRTRDSSFGNFEVTGPAGAAFHPEMSDPVEGHWGNLFQVGTSPQTVAEHMPWDSLDRSRNVRIHHVDNSAGYHHSVFATVLAGAENVTVEYCTDRNAGNETSGQQYVPAVDVGGNNCTVRGNDLGDCRQGIQFGAWTPTDLAEAADWARNNDVYSNRLQGVERAAFAFQDSSPEVQRVLCDNRLVAVDDGEYGYATGECGGDVPSVDGIGHGAQS